MRIAILVMGIGDYGKKGFYNSQEIGLAKALDKLCDKVLVYKVVKKTRELGDCLKSKIEYCKNATLVIVPSKNIGTNSFIDLSYLDSNIDSLICFSDTQLDFPRVYKWCKKNNIKCYPYIGSCSSNSSSILKRTVIDALFRRNVLVYKKCCCFAKTSFVKERLNEYHIDNVVTTSIGLDLSLMNFNYNKEDKVKLKKMLNFREEDKIILFIGRLVDEKKPIEMLNIFKQLYLKDKNYKLIIIGNGFLKDKLLLNIEKNNLQNNVILYDKILNSEIWKFYRIADWFVNLNEHEIYGMVLLEAMFYECKIVAISAPGPSFIIKNRINGYIVNNYDGIIDTILNSKKEFQDMNKYVKDNFSWDNIAKRIIKVINN